MSKQCCMKCCIEVKSAMGTCPVCNSILADIDDELVPILTKFWNFGCKTRYSCSGHPSDFKTYMSDQMYVIFDLSDMVGVITKNLINKLATSRKPPHLEYGVNGELSADWFPISATDRLECLLALSEVADSFADSLTDIVYSPLSPGSFSSYTVNKALLFSNGLQSNYFVDPFYKKTGLDIAFELKNQYGIFEPLTIHYETDHYFFKSNSYDRGMVELTSTFKLAEDLNKIMTGRETEIQCITSLTKLLNALFEKGHNQEVYTYKEFNELLENLNLMPENPLWLKEEEK